MLQVTFLYSATQLSDHPTILTTPHSHIINRQHVSFITEIVNPMIDSSAVMNIGPTTKSNKNSIESIDLF